MTYNSLGWNGCQYNFRGWRLFRWFDSVRPGLKTDNLFYQRVHLNEDELYPIRIFRTIHRKKCTWRCTLKRWLASWRSRILSHRSSKLLTASSAFVHLGCPEGLWLRVESVPCHFLTRVQIVHSLGLWFRPENPNSGRNKSHKINQTTSVVLP